MDRDIWVRTAAAIDGAVRAEGRPPGRRCKYSDRLIARMYFWAVGHDRPSSWAADPARYGAVFRPRKLPGVSQFNRRVAAGRMQGILQRVHDGLAAGPPSPVHKLDGKAVTVSPVSKDRDAGRGKVSGGWAKASGTGDCPRAGYKLHAAVAEGGRIVVWSVMPLNVDEKLVAAELLDRLPPPLGADDLVLADSNYDSADLSARCAAAGRPLLTPLRAQQRVGPQGHSASALTNMGPARRATVAAWRDRPDLCRFVLKDRGGIERNFSTLTCGGGGLGPLPAWVRSLARVRRWVGAKIALYHARLQLRREQELRAAG
jgi:IS5 family transposase